MSYADLVTVLLACFATTYAASYAAQAQPAAAPRPAAQARPAADAPLVTAPAATVPPAAVVPSGRGALHEAAEPLVAASASSRITLLNDPRGIVISLPESASFAIGRAEITPAGQAFLRRLADTLRDRAATLRIEGHTDSVPVAGGRYASNWELSTARASAVVAFLITEGALAPERLSAAGYGEFHPRVANDSVEHRAMNRRVDVVLMDGDGN